MNPELPPIEFHPPNVKPRRRPKSSKPDLPVIPVEKRRKIAQRVHTQVREIRSAVKSLTGEQKRAIFLKIKHDRPLNRHDFDGLGISLLADPGESETLAVDRKDDFQLTKIEEKADLMASKPNQEPKNRKFLESVSTISLGDPRDRLSPQFTENLDRMVKESANIYLIEISSQKSQARSRRKEVKEIRDQIKKRIGLGAGCIFDTDFQGDGAQLMIRTDGATLHEFVSDDKWQRKITFFDLVPEFKTFSQSLRDFNIADTTIVPPPGDAETVCVIDSGISAGNPFLEPIVRRDISRSWVYNQSPLEDGCGHGSGVASLVAYHTLDPGKGTVHRAQSWVASARILTDDGELDIPQTDDMDEDRIRECKLLATILREIVEHFQPKGVRIFVLSFEIKGNLWSLANRLNVPRNSWVARTIDQLSREYDVVFCGITGNINFHDVEDLLELHDYPGYLNNPLAKLLDPGQAALALTAGSIAHSEKVTGSTMVPIAPVGMPSPFSRSGPGFGDSIKPDLVEYGGNFVQDGETKRISTNVETNVLMASNTLTGVLSHTVGTSFAAPRVAHHTAIVLKELRSLGLYPSAALIRSIVLNSGIAEPTEISKSEYLTMVGHGTPDYQRALNCEKHSVLLYWDGSLKPYQTAIFNISVPKELRNIGRSRKLFQISLASMPPVQKWGVSDYLGVTMEFRLFRGDKNPADIEAMSQREDEDEENIAGDKVDDFSGALGIQSRSRGALQRDTFEWSIHKDDYSEHEYTLAVSLSKPAKWLGEPELDIPIALSVRFEESSGQYSSLYAQVEARNKARSTAQSVSSTA